jgi:hypothetical protein
MASGALYALKTADPTNASYFFNTPTSFCTGASLTASPVPAGYATTPVLTYSSFSSFATDVNNDNIAFPYQWVMYDLEDWAASLVAEKNDPWSFIKLFGELGHAAGYQVIQAPALDLGSVSGITGEPNSQWFIRSELAAQAATYGDLLILQGESLETTIPAYQWLYINANQQAQAAHPGIPVLAEVSTANGTTTQMTAAAQSVNTPGYYVADPSSTSDPFFVSMKADGY